MSTPAAPGPVSSTPILRTALKWSAIVGGSILVLAALIGFLVAGGSGLLSGVIGAGVGVIFPALTALSILIGNRWFGTPRYIEIFFGIVLGGWVVKFVVVIVLLIVLSKAPWIVHMVFYFSLVATAIASIVVDLVVMSRMRLPAVSDVSLPQSVDDLEGPTADSAH